MDEGKSGKKKKERLFPELNGPPIAILTALHLPPQIRIVLPNAAIAAAIPRTDNANEQQVTKTSRLSKRRPRRLLWSQEVASR